MKPIYIFGSGRRDPLDFYQSFLTQSAIIVAVDGGANVLHELDVIPEWVIGDFDSITKETLGWLENKYVKKVQYPKEKDFSDFELACQKIVTDFTPQPIHLFCMQGKRSDHFLFNLIMGEWLLDKSFPVIFHSFEESLFFLDNTHPIKESGLIGDSISIVPIKNSVLIHQTIGLKYCLWEETLQRKSTKGLSNELIDESYEISISSGQAIIIHSRRK